MPPQSPPSYQVQPIVRDGRVADVRLTLRGKTWHLAGRDGEDALARRWIASLAPGELPVVLGAGLGEALQRLLAATAGPAPPVLPGPSNPPIAPVSPPPVLVVDKETAIQEAAGVNRRFAAESRLRFVPAPASPVSPISPDVPSTLAAIEAWRAEHGAGPLRVLSHPLYVRLDPDYYLALAGALAPKSPDAPPPSFGRSRAGRALRPLLLTSKYFLMGEIMTALDRLGAPHKLVSVPEDEAETQAYTRTILTAIDEFRPDFVLTTNHMGVDREGVLAGMLARLGLPLASWFVDNPHLLLDAYNHKTTAKTIVFTWDSDHLESLRAMGFAAVHHLPLATDERRFRPLARPPREHPFTSRVSFLGNSMVVKTRTRLAVARPSPELTEAYRDIARAFGQSPGLSVAQCLQREFPALYPQYAALTQVDRRLAFDTLIMWEATGQYRLDCAKRLTPFFPLIAGDPGWLEALPGEGKDWRYHKELAYYNEAPLFYPLAAINFNATSRQMKGAANQRAFDVPACGAFLLTDAGAQFQSLFVPGVEAAVYSHPDEIADLVRFYLDHPAERRKIAEKGRRRVLAEHTYAKRIGTLCDIMRAFI
ncbi:MAG: glycosyltransferase [Desulfovibrionaceae bacterium]|nr:glycosyltransferase [Desulfovibrionaceae bacterium]MBF0514136.1 glycosyltransferase [Desulfovibrionaceae bacterium]